MLQVGLHEGGVSLHGGRRGIGVGALAPIFFLAEEFVGPAVDTVSPH